MALTTKTALNKTKENIYIANICIPKNYLRVFLPITILSLYMFDPNIRETMLSTVADAYINVGVFVAITLFLYYVAERFLGFDISTLKQRPAWQQISVASFLGALPGCGGAIIVVSQYAAGHMGFAAFVAVLVATMGDAAFLILAKAPQIGFTLVVTGLVVGVITGLIIHKIHGNDFLRQEVADEKCDVCSKSAMNIPKAQSWLWVLLLVVAFPITILSAFQIQIDSFEILNYEVDILLMIGATGSILSLLMWSLLPLRLSYRGIVAEDRVAISDEVSCTISKTDQQSDTKQQSASSLSDMISRVIHDTNFIMVWVILAFLVFEVFIYYTGISLEGMFSSTAVGWMWWLAPLLGIVIGFLPGCGPQIIVATLYLQGIVPISTLLGNAISNDGDALFPALALAPKAAILATVYSAVPAILIAYVLHFFIS